jgi:hypothetical protein
MPPIQTALHELGGHAACAAVAAALHEITGPLIVCLSVQPMQDADGRLGGFAIAQGGKTPAKHVSTLLTRAAAVGPIALLPPDQVAYHIRAENPFHDSLSDVDQAAVQAYAKNHGKPSDLIAPTWALLQVTGSVRLHRMASILVASEYVEMPLGDLFPTSRVEQAMKRVQRIRYNAIKNPADLLRPLPGGTAVSAAHSGVQAYV